MKKRFSVWVVNVTDSGTTFQQNLVAEGVDEQDAAQSAVKAVMTMGAGRILLMCGAPELPVQAVACVPYRVEPYSSLVSGGDTGSLNLVGGVN